MSDQVSLSTHENAVPEVSRELSLPEHVPEPELREFEQPETCMRGITIRGLRKLYRKTRDVFAQGRFNEREDFLSLTTSDLVYSWVKDPQVTGDKRLADCPDIIDPRDIGTPQLFISHAWKSTWSKLVSTTLAFLANAPDTTRVW